jgi:hypothetical protein
MSWLLLGLVAWLAVSLPLALLIVRSIREADREADTVEPRLGERHAFHVVGRDGEPSDRPEPPAVLPGSRPQ